MATYISTRVLDASVQLSLLESARASITIDNQDGTYDIDTTDLLNDAVVLQAVVGGSTYTVFTGTVKKQKANYSAQFGRDVVDLEIVSHLERLANRAVTTHDQTGIYAGDWLDSLLTDYAGFTSANYGDVTDVRSGSTFDRMSVSENSIVVACRKICQAIGAEFFIGPDGLIYAENKKTSASSVDVTLTTAYVDSDVQEDFNEEILPTVCRVRGSYIGATSSSITFVSSTARDLVTGEEGYAYCRVLSDLDLTNEQAQTATVTVTDPAGVTGYVMGIIGEHLKIRFEGTALVNGAEIGRASCRERV